VVQTGCIFDYQEEFLPPVAGASGGYSTGQIQSLHTDLTADSCHTPFLALNLHCPWVVKIRKNSPSKFRLFYVRIRTKIMINTIVPMPIYI
jgi:hypothetical protein